jgi:Flp pilus assembly protein TadG
MNTCLSFTRQRTRARAQAAALRFAGDRQGAAALEFALVATPFFMLLFGILEIALVFFASAIIEDGVAEAAREIRTGRLQTAGQTEQDFRAIVCARITTVADCGRLRVDVRVFEDFSASELSAPTGDDGDLDDSNFTFDPGGAGDVIVVRVFYDWPLLGPGMINGLANMPGNRRLISSASAFRNEPFDEG